MSFDKPTRNKLASMVGDCRRLLTDDIRHQLQAVYGLQPDGTALPVSSLRISMNGDAKSHVHCGIGRNTSSPPRQEPRLTKKERCI